MISVEEALEKVLSHVNILNEEEKPVLECLGQVLAEDVHSDINIPPLDNTAMDGYAVQARDTDEAQRDGSPSEIGVFIEAEPGKDIRRAGEDITEGSLVLSKGTTIRPSEVGVLASLGRSTVKVIRRPTIAILATGDELVEIDKPLPAGKIYNSNTYSVAALVQRYGGIPKLLGIARDSEDSVVAKLREGFDADMLITTGGVSMGDYDVVKDVLVKQGEITFWTVRMKPGKPLAFGMIKKHERTGQVTSIPHLGLPGNPVSSMVTFELFVRPSILKMMGKQNITKPAVEAVLEDDIINTDGRRIFARAVVENRRGQYFARLTGPQGSGILTSMALADGLVIAPEDKPEVKRGDRVKVMMLDWNEV
jgi:molybdopterin molybdotransferase